MSKQIIPPFTLESAVKKVQRAEDLWNSKEPARVALAYTEDCQWRNRDVFIQGRAAIEQLLEDKWRGELDYKLEKTLFSFTDNRIAVHFEYEYRDENDQWYRAYGNEHWEFDANGLMRSRDASINDVAIDVNEKRL